MISLDRDLQERKNSLQEFEALAVRILGYLPNILSGFNEKGSYKIYYSEIAGTTKYVRPINVELFIENATLFQKKFADFQALIPKLKSPDSQWELEEKKLIDSVLYTIQQSIGAGLDLLVNQNSARKHVGNRFEELVKAVFSAMEISNKKTVLKIPYETDEGEKHYKCENDLILSPFPEVHSTTKHLSQDEVVVSVKTTSKDRMGKMFIDKILLQKFVKHPQKVIGIFLNDVQRKQTDNISHTLVSGLFMVYSKFLTELEGIYYLDPPPNAEKQPFDVYMHRVSDLLTNDIWELIGPKRMGGLF